MYSSMSSPIGVKCVLAIVLSLLLILNAGSVHSFSLGASQHGSITRRTTKLDTRLFASDGGIELSGRVEVDSQSSSCRRQFFVKALGSSMAFLTAGAIIAASDPYHKNAAYAAAADSSSSGEATIWLTGKAPKVPGQKPRDKNDVKGTRKDPSFLRSISDCKSQCENSTGSDGLARTKEECLSECQDICCTTYEQCTFAIVPRI